MKFHYRVRNSPLEYSIPSQLNSLHNLARCYILILSSQPSFISLTTAIPSTHSRSFDYNPVSLLVVPAHTTKVQGEDVVVYSTHSYHNDR